MSITKGTYENNWVDEMILLGILAFFIPESTGLQWDAQKSKGWISLDVQCSPYLE